MKVAFGGIRPLPVAVLFAALAASLAAVAEEPIAPPQLPAGMKVTALEVQPAAIELKHRYDYAQVLLTGVLETGERVDVTRMAQVQAPANLLTVSLRGLVRPAADGAGEITFTVGDQSLKLPVSVSGQTADYHVSFVRDVMPTLSKMGCNAGTCHGSQDGKNGFQLSLRGYDPLFDHRALTDDMAGRRFNRSAPDHSLMLLKLSGGVPHQGGVLSRHGEVYYETLRSWIAAGVKLDLDVPRVTAIELFPQNPQIPLPGMSQQMAVLATYSDGSRRDVTAEAFIDSNLAEVVETDKQGLATAVRRGEAAVLARYEGAYAATTITVMGDRSGYEWTPAPEHNYVDTLVYEKLQRVKILPSDLCTDAEFIRRVYLDLTGLPPQPEEVRAFLDDARDTRAKRDELIDRLIGGPEFIEHWTNKWSDLLTVNRKFLSEKGAWGLRNWIRQAVASNMPYDKFAYTILTADGSTFENPPASYMRVLRTPDEAVENSTQLFLAVRFNCNKCHDHPFERWTQTQYYQLGAYFSQVGRKAGPGPEEEIIYDTLSGENVHLRTSQVAAPTFPYQHDDLAPAGASRREQFAKWATSPKNQYFAKSYVNRVWSYLLGVGIIDPVDDIRAGNPASNPALLDRLTSEFIANGFNSQEILRTICKSRVYQQSIETNRWNEDDGINYSHAIARRLPAETLYDAVYRVTGSVSHLPGMPAGFRASQLPDPSVELSDGFFNLFGRPARETSCECERSGGVMLGQALNLVNGPTIANAVADPNNRISQLVETHTDDEALVGQLFLAILNREPTYQELAAGVEAVRSGNAERDQLLAELAAYDKDQLPGKMAQWAEQATTSPVWSQLELVNGSSAGGATLSPQPDGAILATGANPSPDNYTLQFKTELAGITAIRLEALADPALPSGGPGRHTNGNFVLNELRVSAAAAGDPSQQKPVGLRNATASFSQANWAVAGAIDGNPQSGWAVHPRFGENHTAVFETQEPVGGQEGTLLTVTLDQQYPGLNHNLGRFRLSATNAPAPVRVDGAALPAPIVQILSVPVEQRTEAQQAELLKHYRTLDPEVARLDQAIRNYGSEAGDGRLRGAQDLAWALLNSPSFLFNR